MEGVFAPTTHLLLLDTDPRNPNKHSRLFNRLVKDPFLRALGGRGDAGEEPPCALLQTQPMKRLNELRARAWPHSPRTTSCSEGAAPIVKRRPLLKVLLSLR